METLQGFSQNLELSFRFWAIKGWWLVKCRNLKWWYTTHFLVIISWHYWGYCRITSSLMTVVVMWVQSTIKRVKKERQSLIALMLILKEKKREYGKIKCWHGNFIIVVVGDLYSGLWRCGNNSSKLSFSFVTETGFYLLLLYTDVIVYLDKRLSRDMIGFFLL